MPRTSLPALLVILLAVAGLAAHGQPHAGELSGVLTVAEPRTITIHGTALVRGLEARVSEGSSLTIRAADAGTVIVENTTISLGAGSRLAIVLEVTGNTTIRGLRVAAGGDARASLWIVAPERLTLENISVPGPVVVLQPGVVRLARVNASSLLLLGGVIEEAAGISVNSLSVVAVRGASGPAELFDVSAARATIHLSSIIAHNLTAVSLAVAGGGAILYSPRIGLLAADNDSHIVIMRGEGSGQEALVNALVARNVRSLLVQDAVLNGTTLSYNGSGNWRALICCSTIKNTVLVNASNGARPTLAIAGSFLESGVHVSGSGRGELSRARVALLLNDVVLANASSPILVSAGCSSRLNVSTVIYGNRIEGRNVVVMSGNITGEVVGNHIIARDTLVPGKGCGDLPIFRLPFYFNTVEASNVEENPWVLSSPPIGSGMVLYKPAGRVAGPASNYLSWINGIDTDGDGILDYMIVGRPGNETLVYIGNDGLLAEPIGSYELLTPVSFTLSSEAGQEPFLLHAGVGVRANVSAKPEWIRVTALTPADTTNRSGSLSLLYTLTDASVAEGYLEVNVENALGDPVQSIMASVILDRAPPGIAAAGPRIMRVDPSVLSLLSGLSGTGEAEEARWCAAPPAVAVYPRVTGLVDIVSLQALPRGECGATASIAEALQRWAPLGPTLGVALALYDAYGNPAPLASIIWLSPLPGAEPPRHEARQGNQTETKAPDYTTAAPGRTATTPIATTPTTGTVKPEPSSWRWGLVVPLLALAAVAVLKGWPRRWLGR